MLTDLITQKNRNFDILFIFLSHSLKKYYHWSGEYPEGLDGIEIINLKSIWEDSFGENKLSFAWTLLLYPFNPHLAIFRIIHEPTAEINLWDKLNKKRKTIGVLGNYSTARAVIFPSENGFIRFPSYNNSFNIASNHLLLRSELTGNVEKDKQKILSAFKRGNFYMSFDTLGDPKGFYAQIKTKSKNYLFGDTLKLEKNTKLEVHLGNQPTEKFEINIIKDSRLYTSSNKNDLSIDISSPGNYRIEVKVKPNLPFPEKDRWLPWIYTNNFRVI